MINFTNPILAKNINDVSTEEIILVAKQYYSTKRLSNGYLYRVFREFSTRLISFLTVGNFIGYIKIDLEDGGYQKYLNRYGDDLRQELGNYAFNLILDKVNNQTSLYLIQETVENILAKFLYQETIEPTLSNLDTFIVDGWDSVEKAITLTD